MCDYCGCEEIEAIAELEAEHDRLRELARGLATAARCDDALAAAVFAAEMRAVFRPHTAVEEDGLFPAMAKEFPEQIGELSDEHRALEILLEQLADGPVPHDWREQVSGAVHALFEHILKEQDGVFPASVTTLGPHDWDDVAQVRARVGSALLTGRTG